MATILRASTLDIDEHDDILILYFIVQVVGQLLRDQRRYI